MGNDSRPSWLVLGEVKCLSVWREREKEKDREDKCLKDRERRVNNKGYELRSATFISWREKLFFFTTFL